MYNEDDDEETQILDDPVLLHNLGQEHSLHFQSLQQPKVNLQFRRCGISKPKYMWHFKARQQTDGGGESGL